VCDVCVSARDTGENVPVRSCAICSIVCCRHEARKASVRQGGDWETKVVCLEWTSCLTRHAKEIIR
jgi:hypothetical protein